MWEFATGLMDFAWSAQTFAFSARSAATDVSAFFFFAIGFDGIYNGIWCILEAGRSFYNGILRNLQGEMRIWLGSHRCFSVLAKIAFFFKQKNVLYEICCIVGICNGNWWIFASLPRLSRSSPTRLPPMFQRFFFARKFDGIYIGFWCILESGRSFYKGILRNLQWEMRIWLGSHRCFSVSAKFCKVPKWSKKYMNLQRGFDANYNEIPCKFHPNPL